VGRVLGRSTSTLTSSRNHKTRLKEVVPVIVICAKLIDVVDAEITNSRALQPSLPAMTSAFLATVSFVSRATKLSTTGPCSTHSTPGQLEHDHCPTVPPSPPLSPPWIGRRLPLPCTTTPLHLAVHGPVPLNPPQLNDKDKE
jgi:hypothetical protein